MEYVIFPQDPMAGIDLLLYSALAVLLAPLVASCMYLHQNSPANSIRRLKALQLKPSRTKAEEIDIAWGLLHTTYNEKTQLQASVRQLLRREKRLVAVSNAMKERAANGDANTDALLQRAEHALSKAAALNAQICTTEANIRQLEDKESELESLLDKLKLDEQIATTKLITGQSAKAADQLLARSQVVIANIESIVQSREERILELESTNSNKDQAFPVSKLSIDDQRKIEDAISTVARIGNFVMAKCDAARSAIICADPNINRAYKRLEGLRQTARKLADGCNHTEEEFEKKLSGMRDLIQSYSEKMSALTDEAAIKREKTSIQALESRAVELSDTLKVLRRKNLSNEQTLYRVGNIVRRLYILKLLLTALPGAHLDETLQFTKFANSLFSYLEKAQQLEDEPNCNFAERLVALEDAVLRCYIRIAKGQAGTLSSRRWNDFQNALSTIKKTIALEDMDANSDFNKWNSIAEQAQEDHKELLFEVAKQRSKQSAELLRTTNHSLELISIVSTLHFGSRDRGSSSDK